MFIGSLKGNLVQPSNHIACYIWLHYSIYSYILLDQSYGKITGFEITLMSYDFVFLFWLAMISVRRYTLLLDQSPGTIQIMQPIPLQYTVSTNQSNCSTQYEPTNQILAHTVPTNQSNHDIKCQQQIALQETSWLIWTCSRMDCGMRCM